MTIEMNLGITCGCLSGVKPVLAAVFPRFFGSSYKTPTHPTAYGRTGRATQPDSFPFQPLSGASSISKARDHKVEHAVSIEDIGPEDKVQRNFAWASSSGHSPDAQVPHNAIAVQTVVVREEENVSSTPKSGLDGKGDAGSEEWIMEDSPEPIRR